MITELICAWAICLSINNEIKHCTKHKLGTQYEAVKAVSELSGVSGELLSIECVKKGEKFSIDWSKK